MAQEKKRAEEIMNHLHERARPLGFTELRYSHLPMGKQAVTDPFLFTSLFGLLCDGHFSEHELKVLQRKQAAELASEEERKRKQSEIKAATTPYYHAKALDLVMAEDKARADAERIKLTQLKDMADKSKQYAVLIREMYVPKIDPKKETELKKRVSKMHPVRPPPIKDPYVRLFRMQCPFCNPVQSHVHIFSGDSFFAQISCMCMYSSMYVCMYMRVV